jgi:hypothetical protein
LDILGVRRAVSIRSISSESKLDEAKRDLSYARQALRAAILERDAKPLPEHDVAHAVRLRVLGLLNGARDFWREHKQTLETAKTREDESLAARERGHEAWATHVTAFPDVPMPHLSTEAWRERLFESRAMRDQPENSTLLSKTAEAEDTGRQLSEAFRNEFLSLLVHAFSKIRDIRDDLNRDMERHQFYGEKYVFRMTQVERFSPIINLVQRATEDPNWTMPLLSMLGDETEERLAIRTIANMIENNDEKGLSDLRDPKAYWTFDVLVKDPVTNATVSTMAARMKKGSIGPAIYRHGRCRLVEGFLSRPQQRFARSDAARRCSERVGRGAFRQDAEVHQRRRASNHRCRPRRTIARMGARDGHIHQRLARRQRHISRS